MELLLNLSFQIIVLYQSCCGLVDCPIGFSVRVALG